MTQTTPTPVAALPPAPSTSVPSTFSSLADAFIAALAGFVSQVNAIATNVYNNAVDAYNNAVLAVANATSAIAAANAVKWVSGTNYAQGNGVWSPINFQSYRCKVAGVSTTDPSLDSTNWQILGGLPWAIKAAAYTAIPGDKLLCDTSVAAFSITFPATPAVNTEIPFADYAGTFAANNLTVLRNGNLIEGQALDIDLDINNFAATAIYTGATKGWVFR